MSRPRGRSTTCVIMEGYLTIPPDRGTILGRAIWKTRYVVIGSAQGEVDDGKSRSSSISTDSLTYLSIYKNMDDWEPSQQFAVNNVTSCQVQMVAHRKQGPVLPTLIVTITPDPATEKLRKRRSSRAATLVSNRDNGPIVLWFRTDSDVGKLHEWARTIQVASQPSASHNLVMSPMSPSPLTPSSPSFQDPFLPFPTRDASDFSGGSGRPPSAPSAARVSLRHKASTSLHTHRERPLTLSDVPSLKSRRSDLSSPTSSVANTATTHSYASIMPSDVPGSSEMDGDLFGWTSAQGRPAVLQSPTRTIRDSMSSTNPLSPAPLLENSSSPPGPRETILDRAFQLKYIPGSDQTIPGEEKLSSLARFEALMQQVDNRTTESRRRSVRPMSVREQLELKSAWELDESDDEDAESDSDDSDDTEGELSAADRDIEADTNSIRPEYRRTASAPLSRPRQPPQQQQKQQQQQQQRPPKTPVQSPRGTAGPRSPILFNPEALAALNDGGSPDRPRLAHRMHHAIGSLSLGQGAMHPATAAASGLDSSPASAISSSEASMHEDTSGLNPAASYRTSTILEGQQQGQWRHSAASSNNGGKRLSFTDFTRRLSTTGNMLMSSQQSSGGTPPPTMTTAAGGDADSGSRRSSVFQPRAASGTLMASPRVEGTERSEKCKSWRNSVGMLGNEGGFL